MAISVETFFLDPTHEGTLQQQLQQIVAAGILSGRYRAGEKLPSSRGLAQHLGISRITVTLAYTELVANDYLSSRGRSGYFVSENAPRLPVYDQPRSEPGDEVDWNRAFGQRFSAYIPVLRPADWRRYPYPFIYGQTDLKLFDHQNWRLCALQALGQKDFESMTADQYESDDPKLIEFIVRHILPRRGITARPEQVLLTLGAQNALWLTSQLLLNQRRTAVMETPCYPALREILAQTRCNPVAIPVDEEGLAPSRIPAGTDVVFTTPSHQSPTNATMPLARRKALLEAARREGFLIVEDDYEFEMSFLNRPSPALKSLDQSGRVIYIGSFSKAIFPGLRLGYLVGSETFIQEARALRGLVLRHPPGHIQRTVAYFLSLGHFDAQIARMSRAYAERRKVMEEAIALHGLTVAGPSAIGGSSLWMRAPARIDTMKLAERLRSQGVLIEPGRAFFGAEDETRNFYRLAYSSIPSERIAEGIGKIGAMLNNQNLDLS